MSNPPPAGPQGSNWREPSNYRPLNVRDALSYLDQVKVSDEAQGPWAVLALPFQVLTCTL